MTASSSDARLLAHLLVCGSQRSLKLPGSILGRQPDPMGRLRTALSCFITHYPRGVVSSSTRWSIILSTFFWLVSRRPRVVNGCCSSWWSSTGDIPFSCLLYRCRRTESHNNLHTGQANMLFAARSAATSALRRGLGHPQPHFVRHGARRMMGGGGHSPAPHPSQPKQAFLFNEGPGPRKVEMWEPITSTVYWSAFLILVVGLYNAPETRIQVWKGDWDTTRGEKRLELCTKNRRRRNHSHL